MGEFTVEHKTTARYIFVVNPFDQLLDPKVGLFKTGIYKINIILSLDLFIRILILL